MPTMQQNTFAGRALPGPAGELKHTPRSPGRKEGPNSKGREGRKGEGMGEEIRKREGRGRIERDREKRREGALPTPTFSSRTAHAYLSTALLVRMSICRS